MEIYNVQDKPSTELSEETQESNGLTLVDDKGTQPSYTEPEPKPKTNPEPKPMASPEPTPEPTPEPESKPENKPEDKAEVSSSVKEDKKEKEVKSREVKISSTKRNKVNNPFKVAASKGSHLIYWENTIQSSIVLLSGLSIILFTSYYSLINICFALVISLLGLSWVVVSGKKQCQNLLNSKYVNPFERYLDKPFYIERASFEKYLDVCVDGINFVLQESQEIILVESPSRTFKYIVSLYLLWTTLGWLSIHALASIALVLGFSIPIVYKRNKAFVDEKLEKAQGFADSHLERATGLLKHHTKGVVEKGRSFAANKGWVKEE